MKDTLRYVEKDGSPLRQPWPRWLCLLYPVAVIVLGVLGLLYVRAALWLGTQIAALVH